jgi:hypothetical protein
VALIAVLVGAMGSVALTLRAGQRTPRLLLLVFVVWVLCPFAALAWASAVSPRWAVLTRATLFCVTLLVTIGSLAIYGGLVQRPAGTANAFLFVVVPPVSLLLAAIAVALVALLSRKRSAREEEHR